MREQSSVPAAIRVADLQPATRNANLIVRVHNIGAPQRIPDRAGGGPDKQVAEALVGDGSANVILSLWNDEIGTIKAGDVVEITGAYARIVRGHLRLCLSRGVPPRRVNENVEADARGPNVSDTEHADEHHARSGGRGDPARRPRW